MRRALVVLAFALGCDSEAQDEWFPASSYLMESIDREWYRGLRLEFTEDREIHASAGCNTLFGHYRLSGGELVVPPYFGRNDFSCRPSQLMSQERWMEEFLYSAPTYEVDGPELILSDTVVTIVLVDETVADLDRPLVGSRWWIQATWSESSVEVWDQLNTGAITFDADGRVEIEGPCAWGSANYVTDGDSLAFADVAIDPSQCEDHSAAGFVDEHVRVLLGMGALTYAIDGAELLLHDGDLGLVLRTR
jgi:heat shock protein HslJ